jgi:hypothetical protein
MPSSKYLAVNTAGNQVEQSAISSSTGTASAGGLVALDEQGKLNPTLFPSGIGGATQPAIASEELAAGAQVNFWEDAGVMKIRNADASGGHGKRSDGYVSAAVTAGGVAAVQTDNGTIIAGLTGLIQGQTYFLSPTSPGGLTLTPPTTAGHLLQIIGKALTSTTLKFEPSEGITRG